MVAGRVPGAVCWQCPRGLSEWESHGYLWHFRGNEKQTYNVALYSSYDNLPSRSFPLPGTWATTNRIPAKNIVWDATTDLGEYNAVLTFRVVAVPLAMPYSFIQPASSSYRRGKRLKSDGRGGLASDDITIELLKDGTVLRQIVSGTKKLRCPKLGPSKTCRKAMGIA